MVGVRPRVELLGIGFDRLTAPEVVELVASGAESGRGGWVMPTNLDVLRRVYTEPEIRPLFDQADVVLADGMPLVWACRLRGAPLPERVAGSDLLEPLAGEAARRGLRIYLLGGNPGAAEGAAARLRERHPGLDVHTSSPPMGFDKDPEAFDAAVAEVVAARPAMVFAAFGFPKQERVIERLRPELPDAWCMGVGITLSFLSGELARAPAPLRRLGLEWAHRLVQEPERLARRYLVDDLSFLPTLLFEALRARRRARCAGS